MSDIQKQSIESGLEDSEINRIHEEEAKNSDPYVLPCVVFAIVAGLFFWGGREVIESTGGYKLGVVQGGPGNGDGAVAGVFDWRKTGEKIYKANCVACHQADGSGMAGSFPPLAESDWVTGDETVLTKILLQGLQGPIEVKGVTYNGNMPAFGHLSDQELHALLSYIRTNFGNDASEISEEQVAEIRSSVSRTTPWTVEALMAK